MRTQNLGSLTVPTQGAAATDVDLTEEDLRRLAEAAPVGAAAGDRYPDMSTVHR